MKTETNRWEDYAWREARRHVFELQRRVDDAELKDDKDTRFAAQLRIPNSLDAKMLAVRQVAQFSKGRFTAGIDGVKCPRPADRMRMAIGLTIHHRPSSVRRVMIPKPGKKEKRPLGIPNMIDRAHQALLVLALEAQWEARFSGRQYGFRKGRGAQDAIGFLQRHLRKTGPKWVLEIDIEKFFDRINHDELLRRLDAPPSLEAAVRRTLVAGVLALGEFTASTEGTPQGGPLSPTLANVALAGLEAHLDREFRRHYAGRTTALGKPTLAIYADDAVVLHAKREVVEWSRTAIESYLAPLGLNLSPEKTRVSHTQQPTRPNEVAGFDFLGFHVQHVWTMGTEGERIPYLLATPSARSVQRFYEDCAERIDKLKLSKKHRGARQDRQAVGKKDPVTVMIHDLNRRIRGWSNYFIRCNAKQAFTRLDHLLHQKLWTWSIRRFDRKRREWIIDHLFSSIETDKKGLPLLRQSGEPRDRKWAFKSPFVLREQAHVTLHKLADPQLRKQILVRPHKRFFDGDWPYWQRRMKTRYPGTPPMVSIAALRRQEGKCETCGEPILQGQRLAKSKVGRLTVLTHEQC